MATQFSDNSQVSPSVSCVVRNCFIELIDDSPVLTRPRRPSSLPPCAFFDPQRAGRSRLESIDLKPLEFAHSDGRRSSRSRPCNQSVGLLDDSTSEIASGISEAGGDNQDDSVFQSVGMQRGQSHSRRHQDSLRSRRSSNKSKRIPPSDVALAGPSMYFDGFNAGIAAACVALRADTPMAPGLQHGLGAVVPAHFDSRPWPTPTLGNYATSDYFGNVKPSCPLGSDVSTAEGSSECASLPPKPDCHVIWCDNRVFKESSAPMKCELEAETCLPVKVHKCAEKAIRPLRKRENSQKYVHCVVLVSASNAAEMLSYIQNVSHVSARVVVLCDKAQKHDFARADLLARSSPLVTACTQSWAEAVAAVGDAVASLV